MVKLFICAALIALAQVYNVAAATTSHTLALWPDDAPFSTSSELLEQLQPAKGDNVQRLTNVTSPTLTIYPAENTSGPVTAVMICPGGAYKILAVNIEGREVAQWLNSIGITAAVLKYRVPDNRDGALADAQRGISLLRQHAADWNIDPAHIGILGFSAGGHLAARTSNTDARNYSPLDAADNFSHLPNFTVLVYPAYLGNNEYKLNSDVRITSSTPPAFVVQTQDDRKYVASSIAYTIALHQAGIPAELHLFPTGGHGYGLRSSKHQVSHWPALCEAWLRQFTGNATAAERK